MKNPGDRPFYQAIWRQFADLRQMVFLAGPRQAGKTTLALMIAEDFINHAYFNWDILENKRRLIEDPYFYEKLDRKDTSKPLVILDEIHKYDTWKAYLKGIYDRDAKAYKFLISGSGRLDLARKAGDALTGRYVLFHLWPFTLAELAGGANPFDHFWKNPLHFIIRDESRTRELWQSLEELSGFPEPFLKGDKAFYRIWSRGHFDQIIRDDIRSLTRIRDVEHMEILFSLLPSRIGSPCSMDSLARDVKVSFDSIKSWLKVFEQFFLIFRLSPWTEKVARAILKDKKIYLMNPAEISSEPQRYENRIAVELWRSVSNWNDLGLGRFALHYIRNKEKEEVDFLIVRDRKPALLIEAKVQDEQVPKSLYKFQSTLRIPAVLLVNQPGIARLVSNGDHKILVISAEQWIKHLP